MARNGCYLYVHTISHLLRLNLSDLCESGSSAEFEIAHNFRTSEDRVPIGMACIVVGSKIYMVGGEKAQKGGMLCYPNDEENWFNTEDVYVFDHTKPESEDRLLPVRDGDGAALGRLNGPKTRPIVFTVEGKFYVLSTRPCLGYVDDPKCPFEVFDPTLPIPSWKVLPHQPKRPVLEYFAWGHKLLALTFPEFSIFDFKEEKWESGQDFVRQFTINPLTHRSYPIGAAVPFPVGAAVEFKGIVFAVSRNMNALVACDLDASGKLNALWVLDELSDVFEGPTIDEPALGFLTDIGGGRMCLLFNWNDRAFHWIIRVQVFHVSITTVGDHPDRPVVNREILLTFDLGPWNDFNLIVSVFMCDHSSNKSDIEADASFGSYSCQDLKRAEHVVDYVKGDSKKPKTALSE